MQDTGPSVASWASCDCTVTVAAAKSPARLRFHLPNTKLYPFIVRQSRPAEEPHLHSNCPWPAIRANSPLTLTSAGGPS